MRHPLHPALVHFPVATWVLATGCDAVTLFSPTATLLRGAAGLMAAGCVAGLAAAGAGFMELLRLPDGHPAERVVNLHMTLALTTWSLYALSLVLRVQGMHWSQIALVTPGVVALSLSGLGLLALLATGWLGGTLVYEHGVGVRERE